MVCTRRALYAQYSKCMILLYAFPFYIYCIPCDIHTRFLFRHVVAFAHFFGSYSNTDLHLSNVRCPATVNNISLFVMRVYSYHPHTHRSVSVFNFIYTILYDNFPMDKHILMNMRPEESQYIYGIFILAAVWAIQN